MSLGIQKFFEYLQTLPPLCTDEDLIALNLYKTKQAAIESRHRGFAPNHFKLKNGKIYYPRESIIEFFENCINPLKKLVRETHE